MSYAQNDDNQSQATGISLELLEMLGQFEQQDDDWFENEINQSLNNTQATDQQLTGEASEEIYE